MRIKISTPVGRDYLSVKKGFNVSLFNALSPPFPPVKILRFDGTSKGDLVSLELNFLLFKQIWTSKITEDFTGEDEYLFVDEGIILPFFLKKWEHSHRIVRHGSGSLIIDDIQFKGPVFGLDFLLYPVLYLQFYYRKAIYQKFFSDKTQS